MLYRIFETIEPLIKQRYERQDEVFCDFGAGDGRVIDRVMGDLMINEVCGMEINKAVMPKYAPLNIHIRQLDFLQDAFPRRDITIAFISLGDMEAYLKLMARLMEECPDLRIIISNIEYEPLKDKLWKVIEPPRLQSHLLQLHGDLELLKTHTLGEILADTTRQIYGKVDNELEADFVFYIYTK